MKTVAWTKDFTHVRGPVDDADAGPAGSAQSSGDAGAASTHPTRAAPCRRRAAAEFDGVLTLRRLRGLGYDHAAVAREVDNDRWTRLGTHTVALHTGPVGAAALRWRAVWEVAEHVALVDGVTALQAAG